MSAMIQNDDEKEWMLPLLEFRNELDVADDTGLRDFRRMSGRVNIMGEGASRRPIPGPYTQDSRAMWLTKLLQAQRWINDNAPADMAGFQVITLAELEEIRRIWVFEKHELEDLLPALYEKELGEPFPGEEFDDDLMFGLNELRLLQEVCGEDRLQFELARELLDVERQFSTRARRAGLYGALESAFDRHGYESAEQAIDTAKRKAAVLADAKEGRFEQLEMFAGTSSDGASTKEEPCS